MKMNFIKVYEKNGKSYAEPLAVNTCYELSGYFKDAAKIWAAPSFKKAEETAKTWNTTYKENGKYLNPWEI